MSDYEKIKEALSASLAQSRAESQAVELDQLNLILFSDLHRGKRNGADDFLKCERTYLSALEYYRRLDSHLVLLGDIEELWETSIKKTIRSYRHVLEVEKDFLDAGRYTRLIGNHDEKLAKPEHFAPLSKYVNNIAPLDALSIQVTREGQAIGELFFAHGHQGKEYSWFDKWAVRYLWAGFQKLTGIGSSWPSRNYEVRNKYEKTLYDWSCAQDGPFVFICGHTHRPVFMSAPLKQQMAKDIRDLENQNAPAEKIAEAVAKLRWVTLDPDENSMLDESPEKPSYFNTGCCSFNDGDITGIEISMQEIRLVKWGSHNGRLKRAELQASPLADVLSSGRSGDTVT